MSDDHQPGFGCYRHGALGMVHMSGCPAYKPTATVGSDGSVVVTPAGSLSLGEIVAGKQREVEPFVNWSYRDQQVDFALGKLHCANHGHQWWRMVDRYVCGSCGATR